MNENYLMLNGKRIDLTEEQLKTLGVGVKKDPFARLDTKSKEKYWRIMADGGVDWHFEKGDRLDETYFANANYCTDKDLMEQRALHETLNRLLWRYSMQRGGEKIDWGDRNRENHMIYFDHTTHSPQVTWNTTVQFCGVVYFADERTAHDAIEEVVKPFMEQHPEFKW